MVNQEKQKVDVKAVAQWINGKIESKQIKFIQNRPKRIQSQHNTSKNHSKLDKLPPLRGSYS